MKFALEEHPVAIAQADHLHAITEILSSKTLSSGMALLDRRHQNRQ